MLQQTQVDTVMPRYEQFLQLFPNVEKLAAAAEETVCEAWAGLGYYRRARHLHAAARLVVAERQASASFLTGAPGAGRPGFRNAISLGGDADTMACIAGAIAEAFYGGVPTHIAEQVFAVLDDRLRSVVHEFRERFGNGIAAPPLR